MSFRIFTMPLQPQLYPLKQTVACGKTTLSQVMKTAAETLTSRKYIANEKLQIWENFGEVWTEASLLESV